MHLDDFNKKFSGILDIDMSEANQLIAPGSMLINEKAAPQATIKSLKLRADVFENDEFHEPTQDELDQILIERTEIELQGFGDPVKHKAQNGTSFTVRDVLAAVEETE